MNRKERLAMIFLVVAIFLLFVSLVIDISISHAKKVKDKGEEPLTSVGKIRLEILPQGSGGEDGKG
jgi:hypothetical protein|tara:strand:+ start:2400 stop:2597 length:198 start_codon:yes stop_codon:yes gene_type:complete